MNTLKGWITLTVLISTLMLSTMTANAGVIIAGLGDTTTSTCTETGNGKGDATKSGDLGGVIIAGLGGVIIAGLTGIIIAGATDEPNTNCGIIIAG